MIFSTPTSMCPYRNPVNPLAVVRPCSPEASLTPLEKPPAIDAGGGSHYFVYIPETLREGRKAPLMFYTGPGGGNERSVNTYTEAAELNGWVIAASVESKNGAGWEINHEHSKRCVEHLLETLPIAEERVYFSGSSGGGAMSFYNALRIESAGNMPYIGYSKDRKYEKKQYCYGIGGTNDYNRYLTANAASKFGDRGFHRMSAGGHRNGPRWIGNEGIVWLNGRFLGDNRQDPELDAERLDFEASIITWTKSLQDDTPYRAHYWCRFLLEDYGLEGPNAKIVTKLIGELAEEPNNVRYTEGIAAINEFSIEHYAPEGEGGGSKQKHNTPDIESAAEKLAADYIGVPEIEEITKRLGEPTV